MDCALVKLNVTVKLHISEFSYIQIFEKVNDEWKYSHMAQTNPKRE